MPLLPDWPTPPAGKLTQRERSIVTDRVSAKPSNAASSTRDSMPDTMEEWQTRHGKKCPKVKELQSSGLIGPRRNQTSRDGHSYQNTSQRAHSNSSNNQHVPMDVDATNITPHLRNLPTRSEHNTEPRDGASGAAPKGTWLATARKTPTRRTFRANETSTPEKPQSSLLPTQLPRQLHRPRQASHHPRHPSCLTPSKSERSKRR
jgi:hypothetical protein